MKLTEFIIRFDDAERNRIVVERIDGDATTRLHEVEPCCVDLPTCEAEIDWCMMIAESSAGGVMPWIVDCDDEDPRIAYTGQLVNVYSFERGGYAPICQP